MCAWCGEILWLCERKSVYVCGVHGGMKYKLLQLYFCFNSLLLCLQTLLDNSKRCQHSHMQALTHSHTHTHTHTPQSTSATVGLPVRSGKGLRVGDAEHLFPRTTRRSTSLISMTTEMLRQQISSERKKLSQGKLIKEYRSQTTEVVWRELKFLGKHTHLEEMLLQTILYNLFSALKRR